MNPYIISQWYKYSDNLKQYYSDNSIEPISEEKRRRRSGMMDLCAKCKGKNGYCDVCMNNDDKPYQPLDDPKLASNLWGVCIVDIDDIVLKNLLTYVINMGEDDLDLHLVDCSRKSLGGYSFDAIFLLRDKEGDFWMMKYYFGTGDCWCPIPATTQEEWVNYLMFVSLSMVQSLELVNVHIPSTLLVANGKHNYIGVECVLALDELSALTAWDKCSYYNIFKYIEDINFKPMSKLLSQSQMEEIKSLTEARYDDCRKLYGKMAETERYIQASEYYSNSFADRFFKKLQEFNLKGYLAICSSQPLCAEKGTLGIMENFERNHYDYMAYYIKNEELLGYSYFMIAGDTLEGLMQGIQNFVEQNHKE